ncbi:hypothetical protein LCGC14_0994520 [marine sediment metagenome]|uniref:Uncharacterized protein n=1 Tax=marine sediment metagenome TaxID=412755 RepID=A0A0F9QN85_9ZZZZ
MENEITCRRVVEILKKLPEKKFRITELAPQLINEKGLVDVAKAIDRQPELNTAILEVQNYIREVKGLYRVVLSLGLGKEFISDELGVEDEPFIGDEE